MLLVDCGRNEMFYAYNMYELQMVGKRFTVIYRIHSQLQLFGNVKSPKKLENAYVIFTQLNQINEGTET